MGDSSANSNNKRSAPSNENDSYGGDDNMAKRSRSGKVDLRFLLASRDAGAIIGRQGKNIQSLRTKYKTIIQVPDQDGPERVLTIGGDLESCLDCLTDALTTMADNQKLRQDANELRVLVHASQAGAVIGKGGDRVKELRSRFNLEVKVYPEPCPSSSDRVVLLRGEQQSILNCLREIFLQLEKVPPRGPIHPYDPAYYDEYLIQGYGGFALDESSMYGERRGSRGGGGRGGGGPSRGAPMPDEWEMRGGGFVDPFLGGAPAADSRSFYPPGGPTRGGSAAMPSLIDSFTTPPIQTQQVTIPHELAGAIIGPRGTRISQIRQQSGAGIKIDDPLPGTSDRIITIAGSPGQISQAQFLLQSAVRQSGLYPV